MREVILQFYKPYAPAGFPAQQSSIPEGPATEKAGQRIQYTIDLTALNEYVEQLRREDLRLDIVAGLNLPAALVDLPLWVHSSDKRDRSRPKIDFKVRRALVWPFLAIPFWWSAGRGVEALLAARRNIILPRIRWSETTIGMLFFVIFSLFAVGGLLADVRHEPEMPPLLTGAGLWAALTAILLIARLRQRQIRRRPPVTADPETQPLRWNSPQI